MHSYEPPTPGPLKETVYQPGTPGATWTEAEVNSTRRRILQMIHPNWEVKKHMYGKYGSVKEEIYKVGTIIIGIPNLMNQGTANMYFPDLRI